MAISFSPEEKLNEVRRRPSRDQAEWFLNSSKSGKDHETCELVRKMQQRFKSIETGSGDSVVDELTALRLLEFVNKPCTR